MSDHAESAGMPTVHHRHTYTDAMMDVGSPVQNRIAVEEIANSIARSWKGVANTTVRMLTSTAVYLEERKLVEWAFESAESAADHADTFEQIRKCGIDVGVVLPIPELGRAHEQFWGTGLILYGWIDRGDNIIRFTGPEVA